MTLHQLIALFIATNESDWYKIPCWGHGSGPSFKNQFEFHNVYNGNGHALTHAQYPNVASYKPDLAITIAWGLKVGDEDDRIDEPWATNNPDPSPATQSFLDFYFNNALVFRTVYCTVDGGRCELPIPHHDNNGNLVVEQDYHDVIERLSDIANGQGRFGDYFDRTGINTTNKDWPD